jgi:glycosyltransferase involved in cell wall biosynthesis
MNPPRFSVVIPCYNASRFLPITLASVATQTMPPHEIIVVDDGSIDDSAQIAARFDSAIRVIRQTNQGESIARNRGIEMATGDWIAFLDADDVWRPTKLDRQAQLIADDVVAVATAYYSIDAEGRPIADNAPSAGTYSVRAMAVSSPIHLSSLIVRRSAAVRFPEWTKDAEDLVYCLDLLLSGQIVCVDEPLTGYRRHAGGQSHSYTIELQWHATIERWLADNSGHLTQEDVQAIRDGWTERLVNAAVLAYYKRNWQEYWALRNYLAARGALSHDRLRRRPYPKWFYWLSDRMGV